jgi:hypothetical protein
VTVESAEAERWRQVAAKVEAVLRSALHHQLVHVQDGWTTWQWYVALLCLYLPGYVAPKVKAHLRTILPPSPLPPIHPRPTTISIGTGLWLPLAPFSR